MPNILGLFVGFICLFILLGCNDENKPDELRDATVGVTKLFLGEAATFTAREQGFFKKYGLDVSFKNNDSGRQSISDLLNKKVDITHVTETSVVYPNGITVIQ